MLWFKVKEASSDGEYLAKVLVEKLQCSSCSVSFADIAKQAMNNKKPALAAQVSPCIIHKFSIQIALNGQRSCRCIIHSQTDNCWFCVEDPIGNRHYISCMP